MYYIHLLQSLKTSNKAYVGYTTNLKKRLKKHNEGASIYTKNDRPWKLIAYIALNTEKKEKSISFQ